MTWWQRYLMWRAKRGAFKYEGLRGFHPQWWPSGYVHYDDGGYTCDMALGNAFDMALGNAFDYASMFKGTVYLKGTGPRDMKVDGQ